MAMDSADQGDDRTFRANFTGDGVAKLRERVEDKLKEFMGDYTDDTLVEYVIVLLKNGRRKEEARNELNVFLADDSDSFVSWLWDHLGSNLDLYVQPCEPHVDGVAKAKPKFGGQAGRGDSCHLDSESEKDKSSKLSKSHHNREWRGLVRDADAPPPLRSSVTNSTLIEEIALLKVDHAKRYSSPQPTVQKKRSRPDEREKTKRGVVSEATIGASRRLLQFAVRDAVGTKRPFDSSTEPSLKRLRSVVSLSTGDSSLGEHPQRIRSVARVPNAMAAAIKAVAEAAKDVTKVRSSGNVFDRLGRATDVSDTTNEVADFREAAVEDGEYGDLNQIRKETHSSYFRGTGYSGQYTENMTSSERDIVLAFASASDNEGYDDVNVMGRSDMDVSNTGTAARNEGDGSLAVQYSVAKNADEVMRKPWKDKDLSAVPNTSRKIVNISVNVNTWKSPQYQEPREILEMDGRRSIQESEIGTGKSGVQLMKENTNPVTVGNEHAKLAIDAQRESQKILPLSTGSYATVRPTEDADSRTIFVNNVHFAATKDSLSRHFNKFGEVLKVVILTDAATGQPKGSAFVEFMRKEAAEHALSLDGTSFMSRILKVVNKSSAPQEATAITAWPRIARGSPFAAARFARVPFARGLPSLYRHRIPIKPGARSLQWKRDAQPTPTESGAPSFTNSIPSPTTRSLTYVRTEAKIIGTSGTA